MFARFYSKTRINGNVKINGFNWFIWYVEKLEYEESTHFWSSGKYKRASSDGSVNAVSAVTKASLLNVNPSSNFPLFNLSAESSTNLRAPFILFPTVSVITMLLISSNNWAKDCRVSLADVNCSTARILSRASNSHSRGFELSNWTIDTPGIGSLAKYDFQFSVDRNINWELIDIHLKLRFWTSNRKWKYEEMNLYIVMNINYALNGPSD